MKEIDMFVADDDSSALQKFKETIRWEDEESWFDRGGEGLLMYAVIAAQSNVVSELLDTLKQDFEGEEYWERLESPLRDEGYVTLGVPGRTTTLMAAMMVASTWCSSAKRENLTFITHLLITLTCITDITTHVTYITQNTPLTRNKSTRIRILNSRLALEHRY